MKIDTVSVIGLGYIGLPTAALVASKGIKVHGVDVDNSKIDYINRGQVNIVETGLSEMVSGAVKTGFLTASTEAKQADAFIIAVPTPFKNDREPELSFIEEACRKIAPVLLKGNIVILESTSPVYTTELISNWFSALRPDLTFPSFQGAEGDVSIAYCPERVIPGNILNELICNDRIIGGMTDRCCEWANNFYKIFVEGKCYATDPRTAEMCKLAENSFRDVNIAFANELSILAEKNGVNVWKLIELANKHPRVNILKPGPGVGGHCIAVDPWFIVWNAEGNAKLIKNARLINGEKPAWVLNQIDFRKWKIEQSNINSSKIKIVFMGLSFKPDIDDMRESPAVEIVASFAKKYDEKIYVVEPNIKELPESFPTNVELIDLQKAYDANLIIFLVGHAEFKKINWSFYEEIEFLDICGLLEDQSID